LGYLFWRILGDSQLYGCIGRPRLFAERRCMASLQLQMLTVGLHSINWYKFACFSSDCDV
jgi:hypothetical protein